MSTDIKNFNKLITPILKERQTIASYECKRLLADGENYGSIMLQVQVKALTENNEEEIIHLVAKTCLPPGYMWEVLETKITFKIEIAFYEVIVPTLSEFSIEKADQCLMDFFPKYLGGRESANFNSDIIDENAVLLMENLKLQGYDNCDRFKGFDMDTAKLSLRDLAVLHAVSIAYRKAKPEDFKTKILSILSRKFKRIFPEPILKQIDDFIVEYMSTKSNCAPYLLKIKEALYKLMTENYSLKANEHFTTITHNDYWVNNVLVKYDNGTPVRTKMVDFQGVDYSSLGNDVTFFIYSSVELSVLENHIDELYKFYHAKFLETLTKLQCDVSVYTFENVMEECHMAAVDVQLGHLMFILVPILTVRGEAIKVQSQAYTFVNKHAIHENYYKRTEFIITDMAKRGWI